MCPNLTFWVQMTILAILRIWYQFDIESAMFADNSFKNQMKIFLFFMSISPL